MLKTNFVVVAVYFRYYLLTKVVFFRIHFDGVWQVLRHNEVTYNLFSASCIRSNGEILESQIMIERMFMKIPLQINYILIDS